MEFHVGDPVVHWSYGLGEITGLEERTLTGQKTLYYLVKISDFTVCVPADGKAMSRLRPPTPKHEFKKLFGILSGPGESLSDDRLERKAQLHKKLEDGQVGAICRVIRDISSYEQRKPLNDDDKNIMKRAWNLLLNEWGYSLSVPLGQVEFELRRLLTHPSENTATI